MDDPYEHLRRATREVAGIGGDAPVRVELELGPPPVEPEAAAQELQRSLSRASEVECEGLLFDVADAAGFERVAAFRTALEKEGRALPVALRTAADVAGAATAAGDRRVVVLEGPIAAERLEAVVQEARKLDAPLEWNLRVPMRELASTLGAALEASGEGMPLLVSVEAVEGETPVHAVRFVAARLRASGRADVPIVLRHRSDVRLAEEEALLHAATDLGAPLCDGIGDAVALAGFGDPGRSVALAYRILQGARLRTTWTEFISCPSCGRTLFDLEETTARIKERTQHLAGVKIAIMGCIVNGPGEMADADFGYVGSGPGRVNLFVGKELVERNVAEDEADDRLVDLIRKHGRWEEPGAGPT